MYTYNVQCEGTIPTQKNIMYTVHNNNESILHFPPFENVREIKVGRESIVTRERIGKYTTIKYFEYFFENVKEES